MARRGTEFFPDLGAHCDYEGCNQLDFLPFECDGCAKMFCAEHRTYMEHGCARAAYQGRTVVVCEACGTSIERKDGEDEEEILEAHAQSRQCDPAKNQKSRCPVRRCKEVLTFSNSTSCKHCSLKMCLKHRFPSDHRCSGRSVAPALAAAARRNGADCGRDEQKKNESGGGRWALPSGRQFKIF